MSRRCLFVYNGILHWPRYFIDSGIGIGVMINLNTQIKNGRCFIPASVFGLELTEYFLNPEHEPWGQKLPPFVALAVYGLLLHADGRIHICAGRVMNRDGERLSVSTYIPLNDTESFFAMCEDNDTLPAITAARQQFDGDGLKIIDHLNETLYLTTTNYGTEQTKLSDIFAMLK